MSYRHQCIAVVVIGMASLLLGSWLPGTNTPNAMALFLGALVLALLTTQGMWVAMLVMANRRASATAEKRPG